MEYLEPSFQRFHDQMAQGIHHYSEPHHQHLQHSYAMAQQSSNMMTMSNQQSKANETKPRLGKEEVEILEREFMNNPKPTTQTKRGFAEDMGVELARINNWFQNRRAKRKQEKKQEAYEAGQTQEAFSYSEPSSPDNFYGSGFSSVSESNTLQHHTSFPTMTGPPPPPVASYNPQYSDPSSATMESLQRTVAAAQAASQHQGFAGSFQEETGSLSSFGGPLLHPTTSVDHAPFPNDNLYEEHHGFSSYNSTHHQSFFSSSDQLISEPHHPGDLDQTPRTFRAYSAPSENDLDMAHEMASFPSQLLPSKTHDGLPSQPLDNITIHNLEQSTVPAPSIDFQYDVTDSEATESPPAPTIPFKSPPPPTDLASRRKKAVKPAALLSDTFLGRPTLGPRTVSQADGFRRPSDSPIASPMRRIVSAGGNRSVVSGRVGKSGIDSAQRSPLNINGFADARSFVEHNYHTTRAPPSLAAGSPLNSSLAPPTPMSPYDREMTFVKRDGLTASPVDNMNIMFNTGVSSEFTSLGDQNLVSPPETPQSHINLQSMSSGWPAAAEFHDKQWHYDVPDEPILTPAQDSFPIELHMPQPQPPQYLLSLSQPVTPAFGSFNANLMFGSESPQFRIESPHNQLSSQNHAEYSFPDSHYPGALWSSSPTTKAKTFQFSNTTAADFSEK